MSNITAYQTKKTGKAVTLTDSNGLIITSKDAAEIFKAVVKSPGDINVVFDSMEFYKTLFSLLPKNIVSELADGKAAFWGPFRLWFGKTRHARVIGITYFESLGGNTYRRIEKEIYDIHQYYDDIDSATLKETVLLTEKLIQAIHHMGLSTTKLTSAADIYKTEWLEKMNIPSLLNMGEDSDETYLLAWENIHEWIADFKSSDKEQLYSYDLTAAYPAALASLPSLHYAEFEHLTEIPPPGYYWGIMKGIIHNKTLVSPLVRPETQRAYEGWWDGTLNTWELGCIYQWDIAEFEMKEGWFIKLKKFFNPFGYSMERLFSYRNGVNPLQNNLAKSMSVSVLGLMQYVYPNGDWGDYYNPIYADMVTSKVRVQVADFIYKNNLQHDVVSVTVDGLKATRELDITDKREFGKWRLNK